MLQTIIDIAKRAGAIMLSAKVSAEDIASKEGHANFVTRYDVAVQQFIERELSAAFPGFAFFGEEGDDNKKVGSGYTFVVDPIDGTSNFICGTRLSAVCIGLAKDGEPILGVVYNPYQDELYYAEKGKGAYLNGERLTIVDRELKNGMVCFGTSPYNPELTDRTFNAAKALLPRCIDLRRHGSAALDICYVAANRFVFFFECILSPWDHCAASVVLREAGGILMTMDGDSADLNVKTGIIAGTPKAVAEFFTLNL